MDTSRSRSAVSTPPKRSWRRHSDEFKARVIEMARQPNTSVSAVALANGLNANMLRRWVREAEEPGEAAGATMATFVQLPMSVPPVSPQPATVRIEVEIHRNGAILRASLPMDSRSAAWLREVTA